MNVSFKSIESVCNRARRDALPKSAKTVQEVIDAFNKEYVYATYGMTHRSNDEEKTPFFKGAYECAEYSFCVFASDDIVKAIEQNVDVSQRKLYCDGTFKICPMGEFKQVVIVFCDIMGYVSVYF